MRIAHVIDHFQPWMGYQETHLARMQAAQGFDVLVITSLSSLPMVWAAGRNSEYTPGKSIEEGIPVYRLNTSIGLPTRARPVWLAGLRDVLLDFAPDIVHIHVHSPIMLTVLQVVLMKGDFGILLDSHLSQLNVFPENEGWIHSRIKYITYRLYMRAFGSTIGRAVDSMIAIGEGEQDFLQRLFPRIRREIPIIRLGADTSRFVRDTQSRTSRREALGWHDHTIVIGHAGILRRTKRLHVLIEAIAGVIEDHPTVRLYLIGNAEDHYDDDLRTLSKTLGIESHIVFQPFVSANELPDYLNTFDIGVWPGDISITAIETMAFGVPIIAARSDYTQAIIGDHNAGLLVRQDNVDDLESALRTLLENHDAFHNYARNALNAVQTTLNWQVIGDRFIQEYEAILTQRQMQHTARDGHSQPSGSSGFQL